MNNQEMELEARFQETFATDTEGPQLSESFFARLQTPQRVIQPSVGQKWRDKMERAFIYGWVTPFLASWFYMIYLSVYGFDVSFLGVLFAAGVAAAVATLGAGAMARVRSQNIWVRGFVLSLLGPLSVCCLFMVSGFLMWRVYGDISYWGDPLLIHLLLGAPLIVEGYVLSVLLICASLIAGAKLKEARPWLMPAPVRRSSSVLNRLLIGTMLLGLVTCLATLPTSEQRIQGDYPMEIRVHTAIHEGNRAGLERILKYFPSALQWRRSRNSSLLSIAKHPHMALYLLQRGVEINAVDMLGRTALVDAVRRNDDSIVDVLLQEGADPNLGEPRPLYLAVRKDRIGLVSVLLKKGAEVTPKVRDLAKRKANKPILQLLNSNLRNNEPATSEPPAVR